MSKKLMIVLFVSLALIVSASAFAEKPDPPKGAPGPAGNPFRGMPEMSKGPLNEGFESGSIPLSWTVYDNDNDGHEWLGFYTYDAHTGDYVARVYYDYYGNDDWLITPLLICDALTADTLTFWAKSYSSSYLEDFDVRISTTDNQIASFGAPVLSVTDTPYDWTEYKVELDSYDGDSVHVAVVCVSVDDYAMYVDDFTGPEAYWPQAIGFNITELNFGTVPIGKKDSRTLPLVIYNIGGVDLTVDDVVSDNGHFTENFTDPQVIPSGDSLLVQVTFTPTAAPEETGILTVTHDGQKVEDYIDMVGRGTTAIFFQDFASGIFPPTGWTSYELDGAAGWQQASPG